jgi:hypothetical protein
MWKIMIDVVTKITFGIKKYSEVCNRVETDYRGYTEFKS